MPVLSCPRCKARVEIAADATHATCAQCGFSAPRRAPATAAPTAPRPTSTGAPPAVATPSGAVMEAPRATPGAAAAQAPTAGEQVKRARKPRKDAPRKTLYASLGTALFLTLATQAVPGAIHLTIFVASITLIPAIAGTVGGYFTPKDRFVRTLNASGGTALGTLVGFVVGTLYVHPLALKLAGLGEAPGSAGFWETFFTVLYTSAVFAAIAAALSALAARYLAEPEQPKAKKPAPPQ